jgi:hypothetical protein
VVAKSAFVKSVKLGDVRKQQTTTKLTAPVQHKTIGYQAVYLKPSSPSEKLNRKGLLDEINGAIGGALP